MYYGYTTISRFFVRISEYQQIVSEYAYTPWGGRLQISSTSITDRGYTRHEHIEQFGLIDMNGRMYDPVLARFLSPDPYVQAPDFTQSFNRYSYCWNNPFKYTDPSGEVLFYVTPSISYSQAGGWNFSLSAGIGFENQASIGITIGYGTKNNNWNFTLNAGFVGAYAYFGYDTKASWIAGIGYSFGGQYGFSSNLTSVGISWSKNGGWSTNVMGMQASAAGVNFDPSIGYSYTGLQWGTMEYNEGKTNSSETIENYKGSEMAKLNDIFLNDRMEDEFNFKVGDLGVAEITTQPHDTEKYRITADGHYVNQKNIEAGAYYLFKGIKRSLHISPNTTNSHDVRFRALVGHELIHVYHNSIGLLEKNIKSSERVAYEYTYNTYFNAKFYKTAAAIKALATQHSFWGTYPDSYKIPTDSKIRF